MTKMMLESTNIEDGMEEVLDEYEDNMNKMMEDIPEHEETERTPPVLVIQPFEWREKCEILIQDVGVHQEVERVEDSIEETDNNDVSLSHLIISKDTEGIDNFVLKNGNKPIDLFGQKGPENSKEN